MTGQVSLKPLTEQELVQIWQMGFREQKPAWKEWNAPYFDDYQPYDSFDHFKQSADYRSLISEQNRGIFLDGQVIGAISRYWECEATR